MASALTVGAAVNQLPEIWEELVNAGFESGHAYGKAIRTVKSCVGSTVVPIRRSRFRGLCHPRREPLQGFTSPGTKSNRPCPVASANAPEAQSKDFGIIATDKGWNLYVCGNGGAKPRHADLLAGDIDSETCIAYIDRFLMYYIQTADRLTRTSVWLEKMEGGIEHLAMSSSTIAWGLRKTWNDRCNSLSILTSASGKKS